MKVELVNVTPQMAADWLSMNMNNRPLRRGMVDGLKSAFARGEYIITHQGIAFSETGELLDGQHRLTAISELRDGTFPMLVSRDVNENSFSVMDIGAKRSHADALRKDDKRVVETARLIAVICSNRHSTVTPLMLVPIIEEIQRKHDQLMAFCSTSAKTWSSSPVRLGAIACMEMGSDPDYVKTNFRALVLADFDAMSSVTMSLFRSGLDGKVRAGNAYDMVARCLVAFNDKKAGLKKIQISDTSEAIEKIKMLYEDLIVQEAAPEKKKASPTGPAKSVSRIHSTNLKQRPL